MIQYEIPLQGLKFSTNKIYAGVHWTKRKEIKDSIASVAWAVCRPAQRIKSYPVTIGYRFTFESRPLDTLNCAAMAKCFEDAFRAIGILEDDDPKHVARSIIEVFGKSHPKTKGSAPKTIKQDSLIISIYPYES